MGLYSFFKSQDYLGSSVGFTINKKGKHQTVFGGIFSLLLTCLTWYFFFDYSSDMVYKQNPSGFNQLKPNTGEAKSINLTNNFLIGFQVTNWNGDFLNITEIVFPIFSFHHWTKDNNSKWHEEIQPIKTVSCDNENRDKSINGNFNFKQFYCPDLAHAKDKSIYGYFGDNELKYGSFRLSLGYRALLP